MCVVDGCISMKRYKISDYPLSIPNFKCVFWFDVFANPKKFIEDLFSKFHSEFTFQRAQRKSAAVYLGQFRITTYPENDSVSDARLCHNWWIWIYKYRFSVSWNTSNWKISCVFCVYILFKFSTTHVE